MHYLKHLKHLSFQLFCVFFLCLNQLNIVPVQAQIAGNPYSGGYRNCTWTVWQAVAERGYYLPGWHNAGVWAYDAANAGYTVSDVPAVNSIIVWSNHVALVEQISPDGTQLLVEEGGASIGHQFNWVRANGPRGWQQFIGYIYLPITYYDYSVSTLPTDTLLEKSVNINTKVNWQELERQKQERLEAERIQKILEEEQTRVTYQDNVSEDDLKQEEVDAKTSIKESDLENYGVDFQLIQNNMASSFIADNFEKIEIYSQGAWNLNSNIINEYSDIGIDLGIETLTPVNYLGYKLSDTTEYLYLSYGSLDSNYEPSFYLTVLSVDNDGYSYLKTISKLDLSNLKWDLNSEHSDLISDWNFIVNDNFSSISLLNQDLDTCLSSYSDKIQPVSVLGTTADNLETLILCMESDDLGTVIGLKTISVLKEEDNYRVLADFRLDLESYLEEI